MTAPVTTTTHTPDMTARVTYASDPDTRTYRHPRTYRGVGKVLALITCAVVASVGLGLAAVAIGGYVPTVPDRLPSGDTYTPGTTTPDTRPADRGVWFPAP